MKDFEELNRQRVNCLRLVLIGLLILIIGILVFWGLRSPVMLIFAVGGVITGIVGLAKFEKLRQYFKNIYLKDMISKMFDDANYFPKKGVTPENVYRCHFLKKADRFHSEDLIVGKVGDVKFYTSDLKLEERHTRHTKNGTQTYYVTYFLGRFFGFDFPKEFVGQVIVTEGSISTLFSHFTKIELESVDFNKKFRTYTTDEHNAFYILTPHIMEAIMDLERRNPGSLSLCFSGNTFNLAINNSKNTFEINLFKKIDSKVIDEMKRDLEVIIDIVNELKLNRNIFK